MPDITEILFRVGLTTYKVLKNLQQNINKLSLEDMEQALKILLNIALFSFLFQRDKTDVDKIKQIREDIELAKILRKHNLKYDADIILLNAKKQLQGLIMKLLPSLARKPFLTEKEVEELRQDEDYEETIKELLK